MLQNYLRVALRNLKKYSGYSFINIFGLALGMACALFILVWVQDELSFDRFHENAESIYRVEQDQHYSGAIFHVTVTPHPVGPAFVEEEAGIVNSARLNSLRRLLIRAGEHAFYEGGITMTDPSFLDVFSFPLIRGDRGTALDDPYSIVLSRRLAEKYFPDTDPIGRQLTIENQYEFTVTAVLEDPPDNSSIQFEALIPFELMHSFGWYNDSWGSNSILTYVQAAPGVTNEEVSAGLDRVMHAHRDDPPDYMGMPLTDIHLHSYWGYGRPMGQIKYVYIFSAIALLVLLIACINFMNLSTARSARRAREIGMRKVVGAHRGAVAVQFLGETVVIASIALVFAVGMVALLLGPSEAVTAKDIEPTVLLRPTMLLGMLGITLFTGLVAGSYPSFVLSSVRPAEILKASSDSGTGKSRFRQLLVVVQFGLSVFLIIGTMVVHRQLQYMKEVDLGYDQDNLVYVPVRDDIRPVYEELRSSWLDSPFVQSVSSARHLPNAIGSNSSSAQWRGKDPENERLIGFSAVGHDYIESLGIEVVEGRGFSRDHPADLHVDTSSRSRCFWTRMNPTLPSCGLMDGR
jgi:hypothetical protein